MVLFDSYKTEYKEPLGALRSGESARFTLCTDLGCEYVNLVVRSDGFVKTVRLERTDAHCYTGDLTLDKTGIYYYRFELVYEGGRMEFIGTKDGHSAAAGDFLPEWRLAVYDKDFHTAKDLGGAVMYQIFPDRFYKADGAHTGEAKNERIVHENWDERPHCYYDYKDFKCNDFFMGNLRGIEQKLDYIKSLGTTHIYLNPIFESAENHRYSTSDYTSIDPYLGDTSDFISLCKKAKEYNIKIILDGVFSHTGDDSVYFNKYGHYDSIGAYNSKNSEYFDWYTFTDYPNKYECWWDFDTLPNVRETNTKYKEYITGEDGILRRWMRLGASGWRLDVADELPDEFLEAVRNAVKTEDPEALIIGEVWENAVAKISYGAQREFLLGRQCDSVMNYPFLNAVTDFAINSNAGAFYNAVMQIISDYPAPSVNCLMNMLSTHDTSRIINVLGCRDIPERRNWADARLTKEQYELAVSKLKMAAALQFTLPGIPCIFYGDEAGVQGFGDPACRAAFPWGKEDTRLLDAYRALGNIRSQYKSEFAKPLLFEKAEDGIIIYTRGNILVTVNCSGRDIESEDLPVLYGRGGVLKNGCALIQRRN